MSPAVQDAVPWRIQGAVYAAGLFSNSSFHLYNLVVPLWVVMLAPSPFMIGVILGSRQFLTMILSIHGGALMDRLGTRQVMLFFAVVALVTPLLYPLLPWIPALIVLQMVGGLAVITCWVGAQTLVGQIMKGHPIYAGRLSFCTRLGVFIGPPAVGALWDFAGPWGAFAGLSAWGGGVLIATLLLPATGPAPGLANGSGGTAEAAAPAAPRPRPALRGLMPRWGDYVAAFSLISVPAIALIMVATLMRHSGVSVLGTFYVVYLGEIGISGTAIGVLLSVTGICGAAGALLVGPLTRLFAARWLLLGAVAITVVMISIAPLLATYMLLLVAIGARGLGNGVSQALEIAMMAQATDASSQGKGVALRITVGRLAAFIMPVIMGGVVELAGLANSFYIMGGVILAALIASGIALGRRP